VHCVDTAPVGFELLGSSDAEKGSLVFLDGLCRIWFMGSGFEL
jgi:hypothetical protein